SRLAPLADLIRSGQGANHHQGGEPHGQSSYFGRRAAGARAELHARRTRPATGAGRGRACDPDHRGGAHRHRAAHREPQAAAPGSRAAARAGPRRRCARGLQPRGRQPHRRGARARSRSSPSRPSTGKESAMNRQLLEKPFEPAQIRQRKGRNGVLDYVEGHSVIARLNQALEGAWSFEITHHEVREDEVLVLGKLTAEGITKMAFGTSQVTAERGTGALVSLGDDLKAAATDALKKGATFLGVGLHLDADKPLAGREAAMRAGAPPRPPGPPGTPPVRPASSSPAPPPASNGNGGPPRNSAGAWPAQRR